MTSTDERMPSEDDKIYCDYIRMKLLRLCGGLIGYSSLFAYTWINRSVYTNLRDQGYSVNPSLTLGQYAKQVATLSDCPKHVSVMITPDELIERDFPAVSYNVSLRDKRADWDLTVCSQLKYPDWYFKYASKSADTK